jgi:methylase of polypeptide subunit release factors
MGLIFENLIRRFNELANETAGDHFTPREVIRLMVNILFINDDEILATPGTVRKLLDPACGTGGMLAESQNYLREHHSAARLYVYGQDYNKRAFATAASDMLMKQVDHNGGGDNVRFGDCFAEDRFDEEPTKTFDYLLANPPFGVDWKKQQKDIQREHDKLGFAGRFGAGLPRVNDGSLLFLQHMISKFEPVLPNQQKHGSRLAIVFSGSPLFTGVEPHPDAQLDAVGAAHCFRVLAHGRLHGQGGVAGAQGVILMSEGGPKEGHNAVAQHLVHRALEAVYRLHHAMQGGVQHLLGGFGVKVPDQLGRVFDVGEQHRDLLALAFEGAARGEDLLGEIGGRVGAGSALGGGSGRGRARRTSGPHEHFAMLIHDELFGLDDLFLQCFEMIIVQCKPHCERAIGQALLALEQREHLGEDLVEGHSRSSNPVASAKDSQCSSRRNGDGKSTTSIPGIERGRGRNCPTSRGPWHGGAQAAIEPASEERK